MSDPVPIDQLFVPATAEAWNTALLANADVLKLPTTDWNAGGVTRTTFAVFANVLALEDVTTSLLVQGGFLDYAATGSVTYPDPVTLQTVTVYVTPDPSNPAQNPTGQLGALDVLASSVYNVTRILSTYAGGPMALLNTSASTYGTFNDDGYHVAQPAAPGSPNYSNTFAFNLPPSPIVGTTISAATNAVPIAITTSTPHGIGTGDPVFIAGALGNTAANGAWYVTKTGASSFTLQGSEGNGSYTGGGVAYSPTVVTFRADAIGTPSNATLANTVTQSVTSLVGVSVANLSPFLGTNIESNIALAARCRLKLSAISTGGPAGAYTYYALTASEFAPLLTVPLTLSNAVTRALSIVDPSTGTVTVTIANSGGGVSGTFDTLGTDVYVVYRVEQAYAVPLGVTCLVQGAVDNPMPVIVDVWVPAAYAAAIATVVTVAVTTFFEVLLIGGVTDTSGPSPNTNVVPINALTGAIFTAAANSMIPLQDAVVTLDGAALNVQLALTPIPEVATLSGSVTVNVNVIS